MQASASRKLLVRRTALALAVTAGFAMGGQVFAQATTGSIYGDVPAGAGESVLIQSNSGISRQVPIGSSGHYVAGSLPLGTYKVSLLHNGAVVSERDNVTLTVGAGSQVSFTSGTSTTTLGVLTVSASALPPIDVSQVDSRTVITASDLAKLPLIRTAEAIATLAPGVNQGSAYFTSPTGQVVNSFGGSAISENAYYINGFNTSDPLHNFGGMTLPYGAIDQEQVLTGGYGAAYGRSDGGVINMVGKRGTNEWHFGAQVLFTPNWAKPSERNTYYPTGSDFLANADGGRQGQLYQYRADNNNTTTIRYDAYVGGPLIKDKLFLFAAVEAEKVHNGINVTSRDTQTQTNYQRQNPKWYAKLDWNITDNNILELTGASNKSEYQGNIYKYNYVSAPNGGVAKGSQGQFLSPDTSTKDAVDMWVAKYTGYITDRLTVNALYGRMLQTNYSQAGSGPFPRILGSGNQNPALNGGAGIVGPQTVSSVNNPDAHDRTRNFRADINYKLGDHSITVGVDNIEIKAFDNGSVRSGPGYSWEYRKGDPNLPIQTLPGQEVGAPGGQGYYVDKLIFTTGAPKVRVRQRAQFIEDNWQVNDRWLLSLGLRNDQFTNYNSDSQPYINLRTPQWAPRLGATWDVHGDSSLKIYANAGRYYLAEPSNVAIRGASGSFFTRQYFTYTGIDPTTGIPTGLTQIPQGHLPGVSANNEFGQPPDPKTVTTRNVKSEYQDELIAGFDQAITMFGQKWTFGAKATYRKLKQMLDDNCDASVYDAAAIKAGLDPTAAEGSGCYILNPGREAQINVPNANGGYDILTIPWADFHQPKPKRSYAAIDTYLEHPFDGTWYGRIDYTLAHNYGNTEGGVRSDIGQTDVSQTEDFDNSGVMVYSGGDLANDRRHQIKVRGYWQVTPEWLVGGNATILSGTPKQCLGFFGPQQSDPFGYGVAYHFCGVNGTPAPGGSTGRTPWQEIVSLNAEYRPEFANKKLAFSVLVYNILDQQRVTQYTVSSESGPGTLSKNFRLPVSYQTPRYVQFGVSYDF